MNNQELYMRVKQSFNNKEEMIELFALQAKETNNPVYWYTLFKYLNNFYIDFNKEEVKGFEYLSYAIQLEERNGFILEQHFFRGFSVYGDSRLHTDSVWRHGGNDLHQVRRCQHHH